MLTVNDELIIRSSEIKSVRKNNYKKRVKQGWFKNIYETIPTIVLSTYKGRYTIYFNANESRDDEFKNLENNLKYLN